MCFLPLFFRIKHANIVSLEDIFESKSHLYLVMQLWVNWSFIWTLLSSHIFLLSMRSMWADLQTIRLLSSAAAMRRLPFLAPYLKLIRFRDLKALQV